MHITSALSSIHWSVFWNEALWNKCKSGTLFSSIKYSWGVYGSWIAILFLLCLKASASLAGHFEISGIHSCIIIMEVVLISMPQKYKISYSRKEKLLKFLFVWRNTYLWGPSLQLIFLFQDYKSVYFCIFTIVQKHVILYWDAGFLP